MDHVPLGLMDHVLRCAVRLQVLQGANAALGSVRAPGGKEDVRDRFLRRRQSRQSRQSQRTCARLLDRMRNVVEAGCDGLKSPKRWARRSTTQNEPIHDHHLVLITNS